MMPKLPLVSIIMPVRNEARTITEALDAIARQDYPPDRIEVVIIDGNSTDQTATIIREWMKHDTRIKFIEGPYNCPAAMNIGIRESQGSIVAKIDGHGYVNPSFLRVAVNFLIEHPMCAGVGGRIAPIGRTRTARSNMYARFSRFGVGSSPYTEPHTIHLTNSVQCGVYIKDHLIRVGGFDSKLQFGEDEELNHRLIRAGFTIVLHADMVFHYYVRPTFSGLYRQYQNYGAARLKVVRKSPDFFRMKYIVPVTVVVALIAAALLALISTKYVVPAAIIYGTYLTFLTIGAVWTGTKNHFFHFEYLFVSLLMLHLGYAIGMIHEAFLPQENRSAR